MSAETKCYHLGAWRTITEIKVNNVGTWRTITDVDVYDGGAWRKVYPAVTPGLITTITRGDVIIDTTWTWWWGDSFYSAFGWDNGADYWNASNFGSIVKDNYVDGIGTTRTLASCYWTHYQFFMLHFNATGVPNTDATMTSVIANGVTFLRSGIGGFNTDANGGSVFWWDRSTGVFSAGVNDLEVTVT